MCCEKSARCIALWEMDGHGQIRKKHRQVSWRVILPWQFMTQRHDKPTVEPEQRYQLLLPSVSQSEACLVMKGICARELDLWWTPNWLVVTLIPPKGLKRIEGLPNPHMKLVAFWILGSSVHFGNMMKLIGNIGVPSRSPSDPYWGRLLAERLPVPGGSGESHVNLSFIYPWCPFKAQFINNLQRSKRIVVHTILNPMILFIGLPYYPRNNSNQW